MLLTLSARASLLTACLLGAVLQAQPTALVQVEMDHATFRYDETTALVETYLAFGVGSLPFEPRAEGGYEATLDVRYTIRRSNTSDVEAASEAAVFQDTLKYTFRLADTAAVSASNFFVEQVRLAVPPGEFEVELEVPEDADRNRLALALRSDLVVPDYASSARARLSDLALASSIQRSEDRANALFKNGLLIQPNPTLLYGEGMSRVFYYAEAYDVDQAVTGASTYTLLAYVAAANEPQPLPGLQQRTARTPRPVDVLAGSFDVSTLPSGSYFLRLALLNTANEALVEQSHKFFVFNPNVQQVDDDGDGSMDYEESLYASMDSMEVEENLVHAEVIASTRERRDLRRLGTLETKREWLASFWRKRDNSAGVQVNQERRAFYERLLFVNERYRTSFAEGYNTDRGRTILKYGQPSAIDPYRNEALRPYEIWTYENIPGEGRSEFVFANLDGLEYRLIHSTVSGEPKSHNWQEEVQR